MASTNSELLQKVRLLKKLFDTGQIQTLKKHEVYPKLDKGERLNYLYFTLPIALNFQRSSPALWQSAFDTYSDPETQYLYYPEKVILESRETVPTESKFLKLL